MGACGNLKGLLTAHRLGADSVDSSNFVRNDMWDVIEEFYAQVDQQLEFGLAD